MRINEKRVKEQLEKADFFLSNGRKSHYNSIFTDIKRENNMPLDMSPVHVKQYIHDWIEQQRYEDANMPDMAEKYAYANNMLIRLYITKSGRELLNR